MTTYETRLTTGITRTKEFERKRLASFAVNVGTKCGHGCAYCSTGALLRMHRSFAQVGRSSFEPGFAIVDPETPDRVARDARRIRRRGMIQLCTTVDAWSPEAQKYDLGRRCLEAILSEPRWTVRILTKNAAVARDYDLISRHKDRVLVGLSMTAPVKKADTMSAIEPNASPLHDRAAAWREAHERGLRTYAMFCPLLPGIADAPEDIDHLVKLAVEHEAEELFTEPVNARGPGLRLTQETLQEHGLEAEAYAVGQIRHTGAWSEYVAHLIANVQRSMRARWDIDNLRILLYPSRIRETHLQQIRRDDDGVVWLGKE